MKTTHWEDNADSHGISHREKYTGFLSIWDRAGIRYRTDWERYSADRDPSFLTTHGKQCRLRFTALRLGMGFLLPSEGITSTTRGLTWRIRTEHWLHIRDWTIEHHQSYQRMGYTYHYQGIDIPLALTRDYHLQGKEHRTATTSECDRYSLCKGGRDGENDTI